MTMTPQQQHDLYNIVSTAIRIGHVDSVHNALQEAQNPPAQLLGALLHEVLDAPAFVAIDRAGHVNKALIPTSASRYETGLFLIADKLIKKGADLLVEDEYGNSPAQRCFNNANEDRGAPKDGNTRWFTCTRIVQKTLIEHADWKPDLNRLFTAQVYTPEDKEAAGHRSDIAKWANTIGHATHLWLNENTPAPIALRLRMSAESKAFWNDTKGMHCDPDKMPWMDHGKLLGKDLKRALGIAGLHQAISAVPDVNDVLAQISTASKGKKPGPTPE